MTYDNLVSHMVSAIRQGRPVFYIASHPLYLERRRRELLQITGGYANVRLYTWNQWVDHLLHLQGHSYVRITPVLRQEIVESLLHQLHQEGQLPNLAQGLEHPGMSKSVALWIEDLTKEAEPTWEATFRHSDDPVQKELYDVALAYFTWTSQSCVPFKETMQLEQMACTSWSANELLFVEYREAAFFLEGEMGGTKSQRLLFRTLQALAPNFMANIQPCTLQLKFPSLPTRWVSLPSAQTEARAVVHDVKHTVQQGVSLSDVLIVVPTEEYRRMVTRELQAHGLPCQNGNQELLVHRGAVQNVLTLLQLHLANWSREELLAAVDRHAVAGGMSESALVWGKDLICQSGVQEGIEAWRELFRANWGRSRKRLAFLLEQGIDAFEAEPRLLGQRLDAATKWLRLFKQFRRLLGTIPKTGTWREYLRSSLALVERLTSKDPIVSETLRHLLRVREEIAQAFATADRDSITLQRYYRWFLERVRTTPLDAPFEQGIVVCLPEEASGGRFDYVHVLGMAEDVFPSGYAPHWIWERSGKQGRLDHDRIERQRFQQVLLTVTKELFFYTPQMAGRRQPVVSNRELSQQLGEPEVRQEEQRIPRRFGIVQASESQEVVPLYAEGQILHVTGLDLYRRCAFRFFADRVLHVREKTERTEGLTPIDIGSVMHSVLKKWVEAGHFLEAPEGTGAEQWLTEELDAFEQRWQMSGAIWKSQRERVRQDLLRFISQEVVHLTQPGSESIGEWGFGIVHQEKMASSSTPEPLLLQQNEQTLQICGIVDRVDVGPDGFSVHDYKLSRCPTTSEMEEGIDLQVALYLLAFHRLRGAIPLRGRYALLRDSGGGREVAFEGETGSSAAFFERVEQRVFSLVERMKSGDVMPKPWKSDECQRCSYQRVCRHGELQAERSAL